MQGFSNADPMHRQHHPRSARTDMPHLWFWGGLWRVNMWNGRNRDLDKWHRANAHVAKLNLPLLDARFRR